jgi:hypothetical protein
MGQTRRYYRSMRPLIRALTLFLALASISMLRAANFKLYLRDGSYHLVREYKVEADTVHYYSMERGDWEDIPVSLVDLKRTKEEVSDKAEARAEEDKVVKEEETALKAERAEIRLIPRDPGVYMLNEGKLNAFPQSVSKVHTDKGRTVLKVLSPLPVFNGKGYVELDGEKSPTVLHSPRPDLYVQLSAEERFGIIRLTTKKGVRVAERVAFVPVSKEIVEEVDEIAVFRKQLTESDLYKIWPEKDLEPGEYAVIQYLPGKLNAQMWDFSYRP